MKYFFTPLFLVATVSTLTACQSISPLKKTHYSRSSTDKTPPTLEEVQLRSYQEPKNVKIDEIITTDSSQFGYGKQYHSNSLKAKEELINSLDKAKAKKQVLSEQKKDIQKIMPTIKKPTKTKLTPPSFNTKQDLIAEARKNSKKAKHKEKSNKKYNVPAFQKMMKMGIKQLKNNELDKANKNFTKAQRIIPNSSAVYFYLGQVALKQKKPKKAEGFARRALNLANHKKQKRALWALILKSAKMSGNKKSIVEATKALK